MNNAPENWTRIHTRKAFCTAFADQVLRGGGLSFVIHSDGRMTGTIEGAALRGEWVWKDGYFCRKAMLGREGAGETDSGTADSGTADLVEDLGWDCEVIEKSGHLMRYIRDKGRGDASVVALA